ncbi:MAG: methyltransferase domain-containing protein [Candidatus Nealsonbacteria bacterium]|nr:methyltransferase domain-containing protein [Candidatus Nealsonbacteria bacterium]
MAFLNPSRTLEKLDLKETWVAADFGSGSGGWVIPLAEKLKQGRVYAIDVLSEPLSALKGKLRSQNISNVETIKSNVEQTSKLLAGSCNLVLMTNLLFEIEHIKEVMSEAKRVLKQDGKVLIVDWKEDARLGPERTVSPEEVKQIAQELGFKIEEEFEASIYHWGLTLQNP